MEAITMVMPKNPEPLLLPQPQPKTAPQVAPRAGAPPLPQYNLTSPFMFQLDYPLLRQKHRMAQYNRFHVTMSISFFFAV